MAISKIRLNGVTKMDVTDTTATVSDVASGKVFTQADGTKGTGTVSDGEGTKTYIVKEGKIQNEYTFGSMQTTTVTEESGGYLRIYTPGNNYGAAWVVISNLTSYNFLVCEFLEVSGSYGITWQQNGIGIGQGTPPNNYTLPNNSRMSVTNNDATGQIVVAKPQLTIPVLDGAGYVKFSCTGTSSFNGQMNIKDIYMY